MYYYDTVDWQMWTFYVVASKKGMVSVDITKRSVEKYQAIKDAEKMALYTQQLRDYLTGKIKKFTVPFDLKGTIFQQSVWKVLTEVAYGDVWTYSDIANAIGNPKSVRAVGGAIGKNPLLIMIPCHRVIGKNGSLTGFSSGLDLKRALLQHEKG